MKISFRSTKTQKYKDSDRKYLSFEPILFEASTNPNELNYISATANDSSIDSPLDKIIRFYKYDFIKISECLQSNRGRDVITYYSDSTSKKRLPIILLVKQTYGKLECIDYLIRTVIANVNTNYTPSINVHFTHYSLIFDKFPKEELKIIYEVLLSKLNTTNISNFYIDIDKDYFDEAINLYKNVSGNDCVSIMNS